uniref:non-specific serine/threonine protein kinase n=1 Tax=Meloidogyne enterolobii TaxID=390850 RepID=A0A6V7X4Q5_MELEN|nr:unnamed protein product [Meloidogyne enterolobii]
MLATLMQQRKKSINIKREKNTQLLAINNDRKISAPAVILTTKNKISSNRLAEVNSAFVAFSAAAATSESNIVVDETTTSTTAPITRNRCFSDTKTAHVKRGKGVFLHWQQWSKRQNQQQQVNDQYQQKHCTLEEEETNQIDDACVNSNESKNIKRSTSSFAALREEEKDDNNEDFVVNKNVKRSMSTCTMINSGNGDINYTESNRQNNQQTKLRLKNFKKLRDLGRGAYGICGLYKDERSILNKQVVIKRVSLECKSENEKQKISYEANLLRKLIHPNIIRLQDSFIETEQLCIVMEYLEGGTLDRMLQERKGIKMGQDLILYYFTQLTMAIDYIHAMKVLHRDIKTQNIFLNRKMTIVKVGDFGISKELNSKCPQASTVIGTPNYLSPEICSGRSYDVKSDIWSMGCVLYEMVELRKAYEGESLSSLLIRIARGEHGPISSTVTQDMRNLVESLLNIDENKRPSTTEILLRPMVLRKWMEIHENLGRIEPDIELYTKEHIQKK